MVLSMDRWVGQVAVVTGASSGIGAAIAEALVAKGLKVAGLARRKDRLEALAQKLSNGSGKLYPVKTDVSKEEDIIKAFEWIKENLGPVHILINNAGVGGATNLVDGDTQIWKNTIDVNVLGLSICTREAIKNMRENNIDGHIIHINSISISPGAIDTDMVPDTLKEHLQNYIDAKQILEPENIADAVVYALSTPPHVQIQELTVRSVDESFFPQ